VATLVRPRRGKVIAGVCAGIANYYGWSVGAVRLGFVLFGLFGAGELVYIILWVVMPKA
jgi:phage shock protein C